MKYFFIILALSLCSCSTEEKTNHVELFNKIEFVKNKAERLVDIDSVVQKEYISYTNQFRTKAPIFRSITAHDYKIHLGIPFNTSMKAIVSSVKDKVDVNKLDTDTISYVHYQTLDQGKYITHYYKSLDKNILYVLAITESSLIADTLFNKTALNKRFKQ